MNAGILPRLPLLALGILSLIGGLWSGLLRLGWGAPSPSVTLAEIHGPLMICGFLGTVIGLERAVALGSRWPFAAPLLSGAGALVLFGGDPYGLGRMLMAVSGVTLIAIFAQIIRKQPELFNIVMGLGSIAWFAGNMAWLIGAQIYSIMPLWAGFLVLTIAGERLELSRLLAHPKWVKALFTAIAALFTGGCIHASITGEGLFFGLGLLSLAAWLLYFDLAMKTIRMSGLTRFMAVCLVSGYLWLGLAGVMAIAHSEILPGTMMYDAILHALFLGFVFAMIFGHAPMIFPAILRVRMDYTPLFYIHLVALEISLAARVGGDVFSNASIAMWGGMFNAIAIALFLANTIAAVIRGRMQSV